MPAFRLFHCSDLHFGGSRGLLSRHDSTLTETLARVVVNATLKPVPELDRVLVTGDLATTGSPTDLALAAQFFKDQSLPGTRFLSGLNRATLSAVAPSVVLMPGNHDRYRVPTCHPGCLDFETQLTGLWAPLGATGPQSRVAHAAPSVRDGHSLHFISCDLSLRDTAGIPPPMWLGWGRASADILAVAEQLTVKLSSPSDFVVWLVHFPPAANWKLRLIDDHLLLDSLRRARVRLALFGHTHEARLVITADGFQATAGTASELDLSGRTRRSANIYKLTFDRSSANFWFQAHEVTLTDLTKRPLGPSRVHRMSR